jgi:hypothetical protein
LKNEPSSVSPRLIAIPSSDRAFTDHVQRIAAEGLTGPESFEHRLRRLFPRVVVRQRSLTGEPAWYVYRDGGWRPTGEGSWWEDRSLPRVVVNADGWVVDASATAASLLGIDRSGAADHHFTDFVVPGTLADSLALFRTVEAGHPITATVLLRSTAGDALAVDVHASRRGDKLVGVFRLAQDVELPAESVPVQRPDSIVTQPGTDAAFRAYVLGAMDRMPEPTPDGLAMRIRRLYPHAEVLVSGESWIARRDELIDGHARDEWWNDPQLPRVRYDAQALILEANAPAREFLGHQLVGHHWQDFVTPGTTDEVATMLEILAQMGAAESRFRMPRADGSLVEFDSYTTVAGEEYVTIMRPAAGE